MDLEIIAKIALLVTANRVSCYFKQILDYILLLLTIENLSGPTE